MSENLFNRYSGIDPNGSLFNKFSDSDQIPSKVSFKAGMPGSDYAHFSNSDHTHELDLSNPSLNGRTGYVSLGKRMSANTAFAAMPGSVSFLCTGPSLQVKIGDIITVVGHILVDSLTVPSHFQAYPQAFGTAGNSSYPFHRIWWSQIAGGTGKNYTGEVTIVIPITASFGEGVWTPYLIGGVISGTFNYEAYITTDHIGRA